MDGGILLQRRLNGRQRPVIGPQHIRDSHRACGHGARKYPPSPVPPQWRPPCGPHCTGCPWCGSPRTRPPPYPVPACSLTAVGVENQHLRRLAGELGGKGLLQLLAGEGVFCGITDVHPAKNRVAAGVCGNQRLGGHAVVRSGGSLGLRRLGCFLYRLRHRGRCLSLRRFLALAAEFVNVPPRGK